MIYVNGLPVEEEEQIIFEFWLNDNPEEVNMYD